jgi:DNA-binding GntR family transcriptional regulator
LCRQREVTAACKLLRQHIQYAGESLKQALAQKRTAAQIGNGERRSKS